MSNYVFSGEFYRNFFDHKPPFLFEWVWLLSGGGKSILLLQFFKTVFMAVAAFILREILLLKGVNLETANGSALLLSMTGSLTVMGAFSQERVIVLFTILFFYLLLRGRDSERRWLLYFFAGIFAGAAMGVKQTAVLILFPGIFVIFRNRPRWGALILISFGALAFTFVSWVATGVDFMTIWREGYLANYKYIAFDSLASKTGRDLVVQDAALIFFGVLPGILFPSLCLFFDLLRKRLWLVFKRPSSLLLVLWFFSSICSAFLGKRFFQQYFYVLVPPLCVMSAFWASSRRNPNKSWNALLTFNGIVVLFWILYAISIQVADKNKHRDSLTEQVVQNVLQDTTPKETIWISNSLHSIYQRTHRRPAVKYLYFHQLLNFVDACRVTDDFFTNEPKNDEYIDTVKRLHANPPKVIFWTQRASNSCSDRLKLENFPQIRDLIALNYELKWQSPLGLYFLRKSS
jgi:4-amino-4-deoxy-L-arabinose transferase-like glycosyltransferase